MAQRYPEKTAQKNDDDKGCENFQKSHDCLGWRSWLTVSG
jgi:hypothetical protein